MTTAAQIRKALGGDYCPVHDDKTASLSVRDMENGTVMVTCHAGCPRSQIYAELRNRGILDENRPMDFKPPQRATESVGIFNYKPPTTLTQKPSYPARLEFISSYLYTLPDGTAIAKKLRFIDPESKKSKTFRWEVLNAADEWVVSNSEFKMPHVLYNCAAVRQHIDNGGSDIWIVEGEKDVNTLTALNLVAACNHDGAGGKFHPEYKEQLYGAKNIFVVADNDPAGEKFANRFAEGAVAAGFNVRVFTTPHGNDVTEYLANGGTQSELIDVARATLPRAIRFGFQDTLDARVKYGHHIDSDACNAKRFVDQHRQNVRFVYGKGWYVWTGKNWSANPLEVIELAKQTAASIRKEIGADPEINKLLEKWAKKSEQRSSIHNMLTLAESDPAVRARLSDFDQNKDEINVKNGIVNLRDGSLRKHDREAMHSKLINIDYNPNAKHDKWQRTLDVALANPVSGEPDPSLQQFMQNAFGYTLTGHTFEDAMFFAYGATAENGKSTILEPILVAMGDYACGIDKNCIMENATKSAIRTDIAKLPGIRYVSASELGETDRLDEALVKRMTGDSLTARNLYEGEFTFEPQFKLWMMSNCQPRVATGGHGLWRRMKVIPFDNRIPNPDRTVKELLKRDQKAQEAILAWLIEGAAAWYADGLPQCARVTTAIEAYRGEQDLVAQFLDEYCICEPQLESFQDEIFPKYKQFAEDNNGGKPSKRRLTSDLLRKGMSTRRTTGGKKVYVGIMLRA